VPVELLTLSIFAPRSAVTESNSETALVTKGMRPTMTVVLLFPLSNQAWHTREVLRPKHQFAHLFVIKSSLLTKKSP
jgi:hypothetical protein